MTAYRPREIAPLVRDALGTMPVVVLTGLRQAGKTTFLLHDPAVRERRFFSLDDFALLEAARRDPDALLTGDEPLTIDEAQRCPELLLAIKRQVDRRRRRGQYLLSGSANLALLRGVSESLAGRALYLALHPFTRRETRGTIGEAPFVLRFFDTLELPADSRASPLEMNEVLRGGLPAVVLGEAPRRDLWFLGYEQTYLERDVRELAQVADLVTFRTLLRLAALRTACILNQSELARDAKLPASTVGRYLGLLEASFVIQRLPPFLRSRAARLVKSPKLFFADSGLAAHLTGVAHLDHASDALRGALVETYVAQNLAALVANHRPEMELGFWNVQGRYEVDFVLSSARRSVAIEIKAASRFEERDLRGLRAFLGRTPGARAGILGYTGREAVSLGERLYALPLDLLLA